MMLFKSNNIIGKVANFFSKLSVYCICIIAVCLINASVSAATDLPDPYEVSAIAFLEAYNYTPDMSYSDVNFNVTDPTIIRNFFNDIENTRRNCSGLEAAYTVYVYVRYTSGSYEVFAIMGLDHIVQVDSDICYWLNQDARDIYGACLQ